MYNSLVLDTPKISRFDARELDNLKEAITKSRSEILEKETIFNQFNISIGPKDYKEFSRGKTQISENLMIFLINYLINEDSIQLQDELKINFSFMKYTEGYAKIYRNQVLQRQKSNFYQKFRVDSAMNEKISNKPLTLRNTNFLCVFAFINNSLIMSICDLRNQIGIVMDFEGNLNLEIYNCLLTSMSLELTNNKINFTEFQYSMSYFQESLENFQKDTRDTDLCLFNFIFCTFLMVLLEFIHADIIQSLNFIMEQEKIKNFLRNSPFFSNFEKIEWVIVKFIKRDNEDQFYENTKDREFFGQISSLSGENTNNVVQKDRIKQRFSIKKKPEVNLKLDLNLKEFMNQQANLTNSIPTTQITSSQRDSLSQLQSPQISELASMRQSSIKKCENKQAKEEESSELPLQVKEIMSFQQQHHRKPKLGLLKQDFNVSRNSFFRHSKNQFYELQANQRTLQLSPSPSSSIFPDIQPLNIPSPQTMIINNNENTFQSSFIISSARNEIQNPYGVNVSGVPTPQYGLDFSHSRENSINYNNHSSNLNHQLQNIVHNGGQFSERKQINEYNNANSEVFTNQNQRDGTLIDADLASVEVNAKNLQVKRKPLRQSNGSLVFAQYSQLGENDNNEGTGLSKISKSKLGMLSKFIDRQKYMQSEPFIKETVQGSYLTGEIQKQKSNIAVFRFGISLSVEALEKFFQTQDFTSEIKIFKIVLGFLRQKYKRGNVFCLDNYFLTRKEQDNSSYIGLETNSLIKNLRHIFQLTASEFHTHENINILVPLVDKEKSCVYIMFINFNKHINYLFSNNNNIDRTRDIEQIIKEFDNIHKLVFLSNDIQVSSQSFDLETCEKDSGLVALYLIKRIFKKEKINVKISQEEIQVFKQNCVSFFQVLTQYPLLDKLSDIEIEL